MFVSKSQKHRFSSNEYYENLGEGGIGLPAGRRGISARGVSGLCLKTVDIALIAIFLDSSCGDLILR